MDRPYPLITLGHNDPRSTLALDAQVVAEADRRAADTAGAALMLLAPVPRQRRPAGVTTHNLAEPGARSRGNSPFCAGPGHCEAGAETTADLWRKVVEVMGIEPTTSTMRP